MRLKLQIMAGVLAAIMVSPLLYPAVDVKAAEEAVSQEVEDTAGKDNEVANDNETASGEMQDKEQPDEVQQSINKDSENTVGSEDADTTDNVGINEDLSDPGSNETLPDTVQNPDAIQDNPEIKADENLTTTEPVDDELTSESQHWTLDGNGVLTIYDSDGMSGFTKEDVISVVLKENVTAIKENAFEDCSNLTSIAIPDSVTSIGDGAFSYCSSLPSITIPDSVTSIGNNAFAECSNLASIIIPGSVTSIGYSAFSRCSSLTSITIPDGVTSVGVFTFYYCSNLPSITIPGSVTSIGEYAFSYCSSLTGITIPNSVTDIGDNAFIGCSDLTSITIPNSVTSIGDRAFLWCSSLKDVYYSGSRSEWETIQIGNNNEYLTNATIHYNSTGDNIGDKPNGETPFTDVVTSKWSYPGIKYVYDKGIMTGVDKTIFKPDMPLTREMFASIIYRLAGSPTVSYKNIFSDVPEGKWFSNAVIWAYENGIVAGLGNGRYGTGENITREQLARMLMEFAKVQGYPTGDRADFGKFADASQVSRWAYENMQWAVGAGIISGSTQNGNYYMNPKGQASRAETATMLMKFCQKNE